ncbi:hypothetical protein BC831DRAFT_267465 [Entophlyctis helioformis]|nr:hypothetical protein BC831DRAFT_267465 [Entophlyctis helioformis]
MLVFSAPSTGRGSSVTGLTSTSLRDFPYLCQQRSYGIVGFFRNSITMRCPSFSKKPGRVANVKYGSSFGSKTRRSLGSATELHRQPRNPCQRVSKLPRSISANMHMLIKVNIQLLWRLQVRHHHLALHRLASRHGRINLNTRHKLGSWVNGAVGSRGSINTGIILSSVHAAV